jgi:hypothetical protein
VRAPGSGRRYGAIEDTKDAHGGAPASVAKAGPPSPAATSNSTRAPQYPRSQTPALRTNNLYYLVARFFLHSPNLSFAVFAAPEPL